MKFRVRLHDVHRKTGLSPYAVGKQAGVAQNTVKKYVEPPYFEADRIETTLISLLNFYGLNWRDPSVIEIVEEGKTN